MKFYIRKIAVEMKSILDIIRWTVSQFNRSNIFYGQGSTNSYEEALQIVFSSINLSPYISYKFFSAKLTYKEKIRIISRVIKRIRYRIPSSYITKTSWFCGLKFFVDNRVLIPRSPICEVIKKNFFGFLKKNPNRILDMCTGSGCIAILCAKKYKKSFVDASDISIKALNVAEKNINMYNLHNRVNLIFSNLFKNIIFDKYDLIISNPPYVSKKEILHLPNEYKKEPNIALYGEKDGNFYIKKILSLSYRYLNSNGILVCEVGNRMKYLISQYPKISFFWTPLKKGGKGVFILTKQQIKKQFKN